MKMINKREITMCENNGLTSAYVASIVDDYENRTLNSMDFIGTGGGCTALQYQFNCYYVMITDIDGSSAPTDRNEEYFLAIYGSKECDVVIASIQVTPPTPKYTSDANKKVRTMLKSMYDVLDIWDENDSQFNMTNYPLNNSFDELIVSLELYFKDVIED